MQEVKELRRHASPGGRPQPIAFDGTSLWIGSWDTDHIYEIDPKSGNVLHEFPAPGKPYGLAVIGNEIRAVVSIGDDDDRYFYRFVPGTGFDLQSKTECPDLTGSHLASDGTDLYLGQMHNQRILVMTPEGEVKREIPLPSRIGGMGFHEGQMHVIGADEEFEKLRFASLDLQTDKPQITEIATMPQNARSLAFDGTAWWTNHREANQIVSFTV